MSIKTDGIIEGGPFKVTDGSPAGFVKNNAAGELEFGQAASAWDLIEFKTFSGFAGSGEFDAVLDGDVDDTYQVIFQAFARASANVSRTIMTFNNVVPANTRFVSTETHTTGQNRVTGASWQVAREYIGAGSHAAIYGRVIIHAKTGKVRTGESWMTAERFAGSWRTFETHYAQRWNDTTTNITSIGFSSSVARLSYGWLFKIKTA